MAAWYEKNGAGGGYGGEEDEPLPRSYYSTPMAMPKQPQRYAPPQYAGTRRGACLGLTLHYRP